MRQRLNIIDLSHKLHIEKMKYSLTVAALNLVKIQTINLDKIKVLYQVKNHNYNNKSLLLKKQFQLNQN